MERCCGQAAMVHADHVNSWWGVELLIPLLKHTKYYYFCELSMCRPMPTRGKVIILRGRLYVHPTNRYVFPVLKSTCSYVKNSLFFVLYLKDFFQSKEKDTNWYVF